MTQRSARLRMVASLLAVAGLLFTGSTTAEAARGPKPTSTTKPPSPGDTTSPTAPTNLRVIGSTTTSISLAWDPSTDNSGTFSYVVRFRRRRRPKRSRG